MQKPNLALLELMVKFLKAGYVDDCILFRSESGTPQGSMLTEVRQVKIVTSIASSDYDF